MADADFQFPLADITGKTLRRKDLWGTIGFREHYQGRFEDSDQLIVAIRALANHDSISANEQLAVRSFCLAWRPDPKRTSVRFLAMLSRSLRRLDTYPELV